MVAECLCEATRLRYEMGNHLIIKRPFAG